MPKETIYGDLLPFSEESPARAVAEVHWHRDAAHVQLVTRCVRADDHSDYVRTVDEGGTPDEQPFAGFYVSLDRQGINALIRQLRRARDQAYGRDE